MSIVPDRPTPAYSRKGAITALLVIVLLVVLVPRSIRALPEWAVMSVAAIVIFPLLANTLRQPSPLWLRAEDIGIRIFFFIFAPVMAGLVGALILGIVTHGQGHSGLELLVTSAGLWLTNLLGFAVIYWHIDCGSPANRGANQLPRPDWLFNEYTAPSSMAPPDWRPGFLDYCYLSFWTAACFSAADVAPITRRAKVLMMIEVAISLTTVLIVVSRAINTLAV